MAPEIDELHAAKVEAERALYAALVAAYGPELAEAARGWPLADHFDEPDVLAAIEASNAANAAWVAALRTEGAA